jgi:hypothetical protein
MVAVAVADLIDNRFLCQGLFRITKSLTEQLIN